MRPCGSLAKFDTISFTFHLITEVAIVAYEPDDVVKEKKLITLNNEVIPFYLSKLNVIAKENNDHLALGRVSIVVNFLAFNSKLSFFPLGNMG